MKIKSIAVTAPVRVGGMGQNETKPNRTKRMQAFWSDAQNKVLYNVGTVLAAIHNGKTLAAILLAGDSVELDEITSNGVTLPLIPGFTMSLKNMANWGCPACRSAHGSGVYPSREQHEQKLASNKFFYNPATKQMFTISQSCFGDYVKALGAATPARFTSAVPATTLPAGSAVKSKA